MKAQSFLVKEWQSLLPGT